MVLPYRSVVDQQKLQVLIGDAGWPLVSGIFAML
jgi:hypothetical protein